MVRPRRSGPVARRLKGLLTLGGLGGVESVIDMEHEVPEMLVVSVMKKSTLR